MVKRLRGSIWTVAVASMFGIGLMGVRGDAFAAEKDTPEQISRGSAFDFEEGKAKDAVLRAAATYPSYYDLRHVPVDGGGEESYVTPVRLQNPYGTCWGFAAIAAVESGLLSSGLAQEEGYDVNTLDLSEKHLAYFATSYVTDTNSPQYGEGTHFVNLNRDETASGSYHYNTGGFTYMATNVLASGIGPVSEDENELFRYKGKKGDKAYWSVATEYDDEGKPVEDSYKQKALWYSDQDDWSIPEEYRYGQKYRLKESMILPTPAGMNEDGEYEFHPEAVDAIKQQLVEEHRAVSICFCAESYIPGQDTAGKLYMSDKWAHFTNTLQYSNHMVTIVGYDDNYPKENFDSSTAAGGNAQPEGNGAFLIKNSWGSELNDFPVNGYRHWGLLDGKDGVPYDPNAKAKEGNKSTGYFWISYYDRSLCDPEAFVMEKADPWKDSYLEQMDLMNAEELNNFAAGSGTELKYANVFTAEMTSRLHEISFMTSVPGTTVNYEIYLLGEGYENPEDGIFVESGEAYYPYGGYHRIALKSPKVLTRDQKYSVILRTCSEHMDYICCPCSQNEENERYFIGVVNKGESFVCADGDWDDLSEEPMKSVFSFDGYLVIDNFSIKSSLEPVTYEDGAETPVFDGYLTIQNWQELNPATFEVVIGKDKKLTAEFRGLGHDMPDSWNPVFTWRSLDESIATVESTAPRKGTATVHGLKEGVTSIVVTSGDSGQENPDNYGIRVITIRVRKPEVAGADAGNLSGESLIYTGEPYEPEIYSVVDEDENNDLVRGVDYEVSYEDNTDVGTAHIFVRGIGEYGGEIKIPFNILPAENTLKASGLTANIRYSDKPQTVSVTKLIKYDAPGQGTKTYKKVSGDSGFTVNETSGEITVGAGVKIGTYEIKLCVGAAGDRNHVEAEEVVTAWINVTAQGNTLKGSGKTVALKYSTNAMTLAPAKTISFTDQGQGTRSYAKVSGNSKISVNKKTGVITVGARLAKGTYNVVVGVTAAGDATHAAGTARVTVKITVAETANTLKVSGKTAKVKASAVQKKNASLAAGKVLTFKDQGQGTKTYAKSSGNAKITVSKTGKITVKKGMKKGSYTVKIKVKAAGDKNHKAVTKTVAVKIVVK